MTSNNNINNGSVPSNKPTTTTNTTDQTGGPTSDTYTGSTVDYRTYGVPRNDTYVVGHVQAGQHEPQGSDLSTPSSKAASIPSSRGQSTSRGQAASAHRGAYDNRTYADHNEVNKSSDSSNDQRSVNGRDRYSSRDSGFPGSLERKG